DAKGVVKIQPQFQSARPFSEGLSTVEFGGRAAFVDSSGKLTLVTDAAKAQVFSEGFAGVKIGDYWGFIDKAGSLVIPANFQAVSPFQEVLPQCAQMEPGSILTKPVRR